MTKIINQTKIKLKTNLKSLLLFELLLKALFLVVMLPLGSYALSVSLKLSKYSYITVENLLAFSSSWLALITLFLMILLASMFFFVEMVCLFLYFKHSKQYQKLSVSQIVYPGLRKAWEIIKNKRNWLLPFFCFLTGIIYALPLYLGMIFRQRIPQYIFDSVMGNWIAVVGLIVVILVMLVLAYHGIFALHYCCNTKLSFHDAFLCSIQTTKGHKKKIITTLLITNVILCVIYAILYYTVVILTGLVVFFTVKDTLTTATFLTVYDSINRYFGFVVGVGGVIVNSVVVSNLFFKYEGSENSNTYEYHDFIKQIEVSQKESKDTVFWNCKYTRKVMVVSVICFLCISISVGTHMDEIFIKRAPLFGTYITAHRGYSSVAPENTLVSIQAAIDAMSDYVEIDVQETKDGVVVLLHDTNLKRTTGVNQLIWNLTYDEISALNAANYMPKTYETLQIPTLEEALLLCQNSIYMNIEMKINSHEQALVEKVVELIQKYDMEDQCVITSTNYGALRRVKEITEDIKTGYIMSLAYGYFYNSEYADFFSVKSSFITRDMVLLAHSYGKEVHAWTVNRISEIERMKQLGVDNIITDYPIHVRETIYEDQWTNSFTEFLRTLIK